MQLEVKILDDRLKLVPPTYRTPGSAGLDLNACLEDSVVMAPNQVMKIGTGISVFLKDPNIAAMIIPRSGSGNEGLVIGNLVGLVDSDYQGQLFVSAWNRGTKDYVINPMDRIAQLVIVPVLRPQFLYVDDFSGKTERAEGGFGSTGREG